MGEELKWLTDNFSVVTAIVTIASLLVNFTPTDVDNKVIAAISKILNILALNFNVKK